MQTDDRQLTERAKKWAAAMNGKFQTVPVTGAPEIAIPDPNSIQKML
jgi:hypothetical protein